MKLVTFERGDATQHIGALTDGGSTISVLQAGARAMDGAPSPFLADMLAFLRGGAQAHDKASAVVEYITLSARLMPPSPWTTSRCLRRCRARSRSETSCCSNSTSSTASGR